MLAISSEPVHLLRKPPCISHLFKLLLIEYSVRVCRDLHTPDLYAVKFIDKIAALDGNDSKSRKGHNILHQISLEVSLHKVCADHRNVIKLIATNETPIWRWIAMEWAEGGDLFDKIGTTQRLQRPLTTT